MGKLRRITGCNLCEGRRLDAKQQAAKGLFVPEVECMCCGYWHKSVPGIKPTDGVVAVKITFDEFKFSDEQKDKK